MGYRGWLLKLEWTDDGFNLIFISPYRGLKTMKVEYNPRIYLSPADGISLGELAYLMEKQEIFRDVRIEEWRSPPWYEKRMPIIVASLRSIKKYESVVNKLLSSGIARVWNTMPKLEQKFLYEYGLPPSRYIEIDRDGSLHILDEGPDFTEPPFKRMFIRLVNWYGDNFRPGFSTPEEVMVEVRYGFRDSGECFKTSSSDLSDLSGLITSLDPDVIEFYSPQVLKWITRDRGVVTALKRRPRVYLDYSNSVMGPDEYPGIVELSRISYAPLDIVSKMTIGGVLTGIEAIEALKKRYLVPHINTALENWKTPHRLLMADRGGLYMNPMPGIYWDVAQCDFSSLYPSIMVKYNISPETVNNPHNGEGYRVAEPGHVISLKKRGIIPLSLSKIIEYRHRLKRMYRDAGNKIYKIRYTGLKWILVASFGYLGYRNSRFGKIEAYECVTSLAREIMNKTVDMAREMGLDTLHILIDSIWVNGGSKEKYIDFIEKVSREIGIPMDIDSLYKWIVFLPNEAKRPIGVSNRYFGVTADGSLKIKGMEAIRRDTPPLVAEAQYRAIDILSKGDTPIKLYKMCMEAMKLYDEVATKIVEGDVEPSKLVITRRVGRDWWMYRAKGPAIYAAKAIKAREGEVVKYIVNNGRGYPVEMGYRGYDKEYYLKLLNRSKEPIKFILASSMKYIS